MVDRIGKMSKLIMIFFELMNKLFILYESLINYSLVSFILLKDREA
jgi:hypothetical protein